MASRPRATPFFWMFVLSIWMHGNIGVVVYHTAKLTAPEPEPPQPMAVELVADPGAERPDLPPVDAPAEPPPQAVAVRLVPAPATPPPPGPQPAPEPPKAEPKKEERKPEPPPEKVEPQPSKELMRLKMVEVNNPESDKPPENARFLSDKNRRVDQETRAKHTNLVHDHPKPQPSSEPGGDSKAPAPGGKEERIAETKDVKAPPSKSRDRDLKPHPLLVMRSAGVPGPVTPSREAAPGAKELSPDGVLPMPQRGQRGRAVGSKLSLDHKSLDRIDGKAAEEARQLARLSPSQRSSTKGRYDAKWKAVRSALENFIPEVRPGNQTALSTRAHPFALYVARMHRQIHKLWGFGFLEDLDRKPDSNSMNNMQLWTMVEIVLLPDGSVAKATVVRPSGILPYDVAALDTVFSSAPYPPTPRDIRSADGRVYMHWRFHRDHRQCGTFGVDPYILTTPPKGPIDTVAAEVKGDPSAPESRALRQLHRRPAPAPRARPQPTVQPQAPAAAKPSPAAQAAAAGRVDARDPAARAIAESLVRGFREGNAAKMAAACGLPFLAQGKKVASTRAELERMLGDLLREARGRHSSAVTISTVLEARAALGQLPPGAEHGAAQLVGHASLGGTAVTLILQRKADRWLVIGLNR
jgi:TonB family protein